jgi:hypothetical protein
MEKHDQIVAEFRVKEGSLRDKLLIALARELGKPVSLQEAMDYVYGKKKGSNTAFARIVDGLREIIDKRALPYEVVEAKTKRGKTIALYPIEEPACQIIAAGGTLAAINPKGRLAGDD